MMIIERLSALREKLQEKGIDSFIITGTDPHQSEYPADRWKSRAYFSGFTGSAGVMLVTADDALLWTDSRYFIQAENELEGSGIRLMKEGMEGVPSLTEYLKGNVRKKMRVGVDGDYDAFDFAKSQKRLDGFHQHAGGATRLQKFVFLAVAQAASACGDDDIDCGHNSPWAGDVPSLLFFSDNAVHLGSRLFGLFFGLTSFAGFAGLPLISILPPEQASAATVRLLMTRETLRNLSILTVFPFRGDSEKPPRGGGVDSRRRNIDFFIRTLDSLAFC